MKYDFVLVDVFTPTAFSGNQLAVLPDARGLRDAEMQAVAREFGYAETTFVLPPRRPGSSAELRIFSPSREMPFAGHPTVGSAAVLGLSGSAVAATGTTTLVLDEVIGPVEVVVDLDRRPVFSTMRLSASLEEREAPASVAEMASILTLDSRQIREVWAASVGLPFTFCRLTDDAAVDHAVLDLTAWRRWVSGSWAEAVFLFAGDFRHPAVVYGRMFHPAAGIPEDPATGSAAATLAASIAARIPSATTGERLEVECRQGVWMGRPSRIMCSARRLSGSEHELTVAGHVVEVARGQIDLPVASAFST